MKWLFCPFLSIRTSEPGSTLREVYVFHKPETCGTRWFQKQLEHPLGKPGEQKDPGPPQALPVYLHPAPG